MLAMDVIGVATDPEFPFVVCHQVTPFEAPRSELWLYEGRSAEWCTRYLCNLPGSAVIRLTLNGTDIARSPFSIVVQRQLPPTISDIRFFSTGAPCTNIELGLSHATLC